jgi:hypothetical protein
MQEKGISAEVGLSPLAQPPAPAPSKYEQLIQKAKAAPAATTIVVLGPRVPIILTSRADSVRARMASCAAAVRSADARRRIDAMPTA